MQKHIILFTIFLSFQSLTRGDGVKGYSSSDTIVKPSFQNHVELPQYTVPASMPYIEPPPAPVPEPPGMFINPEDGPPMPYSFGYEANGADGSSTRQETSDGRTVRGSYTLIGADGINRIVHYIADGDGFRASIITNEPGTEKQNPSGVIMESSQPKAEDLARKYGAPQSPASTYRQKYSHFNSASTKSTQKLFQQSQIQSAGQQSLSEEKLYYHRPKFQEKITQQVQQVQGVQQVQIPEIKAPSPQITLQPFSMPQPIKTLPRSQSFQQQFQKQYFQDAQLSHQAHFSSQRQQSQEARYELEDQKKPPIFNITQAPAPFYYYRTQYNKPTLFQGFPSSGLIKTPPRSYLVATRRVSLPIKRQPNHYQYLASQTPLRPSYVVQRPARLSKTNGHRVLRPFYIRQQYDTEPTTQASVPTTQPSTQQSEETTQQLRQSSLENLDQKTEQSGTREIYNSYPHAIYFP